MLVKNGIKVDDTVDDDLYSMLLPGETDQLLRGRGGARKGAQ
jgi:hypothetical protein